MLSLLGGILLFIFKFIGIALLSVLGFIFVLLLIVLFVPFRYSAEGNYEEDIDVKVKFSWLFWLIRGTFLLEAGEQEIGLKVLFFRLMPKKKSAKDKKSKKSKKSKNKKNEKNKKTKKQEIQSDLITQESIIEEGTESITELVAEEAEEAEEAKEAESIIESTAEETVDSTTGTIVEEAIEEAIEETIEEAIEETKEETKETGTSKKSKKVKSKKKKTNKKGKKEGPSILDQGKDMLAAIRAPENKGVLKHVTKYLIKTIKWVLPKKVFVDMELGLEDPAVTGYIAGVASVVYLATKKHIHVRPNFQEQIIRGRFKVKGKLFLYQPIYYIIRIIIDRRVRSLIKKARA